jgi:hypothetical protein
MTDGLTEAAKTEIAEAIRIVREDRFEKFVRSRTTPPKVDDPPKDDPPNPPPPKDDPKPTDDPKNDPPKRHSSYWGEILE